MKRTQNKSSNFFTQILMKHHKFFALIRYTDNIYAFAIHSSLKVWIYFNLPYYLDSLFDIII